MQFHCLSSYPDELYRKDRFPKAEFNLHLMANGEDVPAAYDYLLRYPRMISFTASYILAWVINRSQAEPRVKRSEYLL